MSVEPAERGGLPVPLTDEEVESLEDDGDPADEAPFKKTYLAIDGVEEHEILDEDKERLERTIIEFMLHNGYPISGVRILSEEANVIELGREE